MRNKSKIMKENNEYSHISKKEKIALLDSLIGLAISKNNKGLETKRNERLKEKLL